MADNDSDENEKKDEHVRNIRPRGPTIDIRKNYDAHLFINVVLFINIVMVVIH